jgi:hypothetical protein
MADDAGRRMQEVTQIMQERNERGTVMVTGATANRAELSLSIC